LSGDSNNQTLKIISSNNQPLQLATAQQYRAMNVNSVNCGLMLAVLTTADLAQQKQQSATVKSRQQERETSFRKQSTGGLQAACWYCCCVAVRGKVTKIGKWQPWCQAV